PDIEMKKGGGDQPVMFSGFYVLYRNAPGHQQFLKRDRKPEKPGDKIQEHIDPDKDKGNDKVSGFNIHLCSSVYLSSVCFRLFGLFGLLGLFCLFRLSGPFGLFGLFRLSGLFSLFDLFRLLGLFGLLDLLFAFLIVFDLSLTQAIILMLKNPAGHILP
ncbi:MAG: hypothetical protein IIY77_03645, partial [Lachnospiraceae bacterium]|nr:hypothetical protein [Lachnospiraceae bacterium]